MKLSKYHIAFTIINLLFIAIFIVMVFYQIQSSVLWIAFVGLWFYVDGYFAKKIYFKPWYWVLLMLLLLLIDVLILSFISH